MVNRQIGKGDETMKKWGFVLAIVLLAACTDEQQGSEPTRVQLEHVNTPDAIEIFEESEVALVASELGQVKWEPNVQAEMARVEDVQLRLFIEKDPNMPEYIITYRIWIENDKSLTLLSTDEEQGFGKLSANQAQKLLAFLYEKIPSLQSIINTHGNIENRDVFEQFLQQVNTKEPSNVNVTTYTMEGAPIYYAVNYDGTNFSLTIDNREDNFGVPGINTYTCDDLSYVHNGQATSYKLEDCDEEGAFIELVPLVFDSEKQQFTNQYLPELTLTIDNKPLSMTKGTFSWSMPTTTPNETLNIETDHASPNQMLNVSDAVKVEKSALIDLQFEVAPSRVEYRVWNQEKQLETYDSIEAIDLAEPFILEVFAYFGESYATYVTALQFQ